MNKSTLSRTSGLCMNCKYTGNCSLQSKQTIVSHCEEYDFEENIHSLLLSAEVKNILLTSAANDQEVSGLCVSCDFRNNCSLKEKYSIVLNCESYQ